MEFFIEYKWPLTVILIVFVIFFSLLRPLLSFFNKANKLKYKDFEAEIKSEQQQQSQQNLEVTPIANTALELKQNLLIERNLIHYSEFTLTKAKTIVESESKFLEYETESEKIKILEKYSQALFIHLVFERLYAITFGSQLALLNSVNSIAETKDELEVFYTQAKEKFPAMYSTYTYDEYFAFLITRELIIEENGLYSITLFGRDFLKFLVDSGKVQNKPY